MKNRNDFINSLFCLKPSQRCSGENGAKAEIGWEQAFAEVYQVLQHCDETVSELIPESFSSFLFENMDKTWRGNLDFSKNLNSMELLADTRVILSLVYRDFLCSEVERKRLVEKDQEEAKTAGWAYEDKSLRDLFKLLD